MSNEYAQVSDNSRRTGIVLLLVSFLLIPAVYRCSWLVLHDGDHPLGVHVLRIVPQDVLIAWEFLVGVMLCSVPVRAAIRNGRKPSRALRWCVCGLTAAVFTTLQFVLFFDCVVQFKTGVRVEPGFLRVMTWMDTVASSIVNAVGIPLLVAVTLGLIGVFVGAWRVISSRLDSIRFSWVILACGPLFYFAAGRSVASLDPRMAYDSANAVYGLQRELIQEWRSPSIPPVDESTIESLLHPANEDFVRDTPGYPLLKWTSGFRGEKHFEIPIEKDERPHVIVLLLESFRARDVGVLGGRYNASPEFDRLSQNGVLFSNFYANGVQTSRCTVSTLFGCLPSFHFRSVQSGNPDLRMVGLADLLKPSGYHSAYLTGTPLEFENQGEFFRNQRFDTVLGEKWLQSTHPNELSSSSWGIHDEHLMRASVDWITEQDRGGTPVFATLLTVTNHDPWQLPPDYPAADFSDVPLREHAEFLRTFQYTDHSLGLFMKLLEERGLAEKSIVFVLADTGCPRGEHERNLFVVNYLYEENMKIPLLILAPGRLKGSTVINEPGSQVDLLPTIMDLLSLSGWNHSIGSSLVRKNRNQTVWMNNPFALRYQGFRRGSEKFIYSPLQKRSLLFDLNADANEEFDRSGTNLKFVERYQREVTTVNGVFHALYATQRLAPDQLPEPPRTSDSRK